MNDAAVLSEIRALRLEMAALRDALLPRRALCGADAAFAATFLPATWATFGDRVWLASELAGAAIQIENVELAAVLAPHLAGGLRRFGKSLARIAGHPLDGLVLQRVGDSSAGVVWSIAESPETLAADGVRSQARR